ncbi:hypothetical protein G7046_g5739 [Stylonectria norvegica]|nr:hypothetical protein G7046_g5739 [Stylonectria norvegica]
MSQKNVVVVGAGVAGLTTALLLSKDSRYSITIAAKHMPGDYDIEYASPWAGANFMPVSVGGTPASDWDKNTWPVLADLAQNHPDAGIEFQGKMLLQSFRSLGEVNIAGVRILNRKKDIGSATAEWFAELLSPNPWWAKLSPDYHQIPENELEPNADSGHSLTSVCINTAIYLPWLLSQCLKNGVVFKRAVFKDITDAAHGAHHSGHQADVILNCTGLASRKLGGVCDEKVHPARGQWVLVRNKADGMRAVSGTDDATDEAMYIMCRPGGGGTVLGGCYQENNWDSQPDPNLAIRIMERCVQACPALTNGKGIEHLDIIRHGVGLRPAREGGARVEKEKVKGTWIVHNYGHGGAGYHCGDINYGGWTCNPTILYNHQASTSQLEAEPTSGPRSYRCGHGQNLDVIVETTRSYTATIQGCDLHGHNPNAMRTATSHVTGGTHEAARSQTIPKATRSEEQWGRRLGICLPLKLLTSYTSQTVQSSCVIRKATRVLGLNSTTLHHATQSSGFLDPAVISPRRMPETAKGQRVNDLIFQIGDISTLEGPRSDMAQTISRSDGSVTSSQPDCIESRNKAWSRADYRLLVQSAKQVSCRMTYMGFSSEELISHLSHRPWYLNKVMITIPEPLAVRKSVADYDDRRSSVGTLERLPLELLHAVVNMLDLQSVSHFALVCLQAKAIVDSVQSYSELVINAPQALAALLQTNLARLHSLGQLHATLRSERCVSCPEYGTYLFLPTNERCCWECLRIEPSFRVLVAKRAIELFCLSTRHLRRLPLMSSIPGSYGITQKKSRRRCRLISVSAARDLGILVHGSAAKMAEALRSRHEGEDIIADLSFLQGESHPRGSDPLAASLQASIPDDSLFGMASIPFPSLSTMGDAQEGIWCKGCDWSHERFRTGRVTIDAFSDMLPLDVYPSRVLLGMARRARSRNGFLEHVQHCYGARCLLSELQDQSPA